MKHKKYDELSNPHADFYSDQIEYSLFPEFLEKCSCLRTELQIKTVSR